MTSALGPVLARRFAAHRELRPARHHGDRLRRVRAAGRVLPARRHVAVHRRRAGASDGTFHQPLWLVILLICVAAIAGNQVGYEIGRRGGPAVFKRPDSRLFRPEYVERTRAFFEKYGPPAIVLGRFVPIVRTVHHGDGRGRPDELPHVHALHRASAASCGRRASPCSATAWATSTSSRTTSSCCCSPALPSRSCPSASSCICATCCRSSR